MVSYQFNPITANLDLVSEEDLSGYIEVAGDTMTGQLVVRRDSNDPEIVASRYSHATSSGAYAVTMYGTETGSAWPDGYDIVGGITLYYHEQNGVGGLLSTNSSIYRDGRGLRLKDGNFVPGTIGANPLTLGDETYRWAAVYTDELFAPGGIKIDKQTVSTNDAIELYDTATEVQLTGTITVYSGSTDMTGSGTSFTSELAVNDRIRIDDSDEERLTVASITDDTNLVLKETAVSTHVDEDGYFYNPGLYVNSVGNLYCTDTILDGVAQITGNTTIDGTLGITGNTTITGTTALNNNTTITGNLTVNAGVLTAASTEIGVDAHFLPNGGSGIWNLGAPTYCWANLHVAYNLIDHNSANSVSVEECKTAYDHSQDNTQAHSDYLLNNASDETTGTLTAVDFISKEVVAPADAQTFFKSSVNYTETGTDATSDWTGFKYDIDYELDGTVGLPQFLPIDINIDLTGTSGTFLPTVMVMDVDINATGLSSITGVKLLNFDCPIIQNDMVKFNASGTGSASSGYWNMNIASSDVSANLVAIRTSAVITDTANAFDAIGYQGYSANADAGGNGRSLALNPIVFGSSTTKYNAALLPLSLSCSQTKDRMFVVHNAAFGHLLMDRGGIAITSTETDELDAGNPAGHISWDGSNGDGMLYVEEDAEVDGMFYADGGVTANGYFQGVSHTVQRIVGTGSETIQFDVETRKDTSFYTHSTSTNKQNVTVDVTGWYKITYNVSYDQDVNDRTIMKAWVEDDGTPIVPSESYCYIRASGYGRMNTNTATFIAEITANSVITLCVDGALATGAFSASACDDDTIADHCWLLIEKI